MWCKITGGQEAVSISDLAGLILSLIQDLPKGHFIKARFKDNLTYAEISAKTGVSKSRASQLTIEGLQVLRPKLAVLITEITKINYSPFENKNSVASVLNILKVISEETSLEEISFFEKLFIGLAKTPRWYFYNK